MPNEKEIEFVRQFAINEVISNADAISGLSETLVVHEVMQEGGQPVVARIRRNQYDFYEV